MASFGSASNHIAGCDIWFIDFLQLLNKEEQEMPDRTLSLYHLRRDKDATCQFPAATLRVENHNLEAKTDIKDALEPIFSGHYLKVIPEV